MCVATPPASPIASSLQFRLPATISPSGTALGCEDRPFPCPEPGCHQQFKRKFTLAEHMKTHTGERPFVCPVHTCGKNFATSGNLARHKRLHPWLKPQVCLVDGCGRSFSNEAKLERHLRTHFKGPRIVLVCKVKDCEKSFSSMGNLTRHMKHQHGSYTTMKYTQSRAENSATSTRFECTRDNELATLFGTLTDPATKAFSPLKAGEVSPVTDEELLEFLDELF